MRIKVMFLLLALGLGCGRSAGQETVRREVAIAGMVCDRDSLFSLPGATCRSGESIEGTDEQGRFFLTAGVGDTLRFSHVGYVPVEMVVADSLEREDYLLGVFMSRDTVMLSEVLVVPRFLEREVRLNPFLQNAYQNLNGALRAASRPVEKMDSEMNQRMQIEEFARRVEMKGAYKAMWQSCSAGWWQIRKDGMNLQKAWMRQAFPRMLRQWQVHLQGSWMETDIPSTTSRPLFLGL